jgi:hypothetical protein
MKYINTQTLLNKDILTYQEILNIKKRLTGYSKNNHELKKDFTSDETISQPELVKMTVEDYNWQDEYKITPEHTAKGIEYLQRVAFKPSKLQEGLKAVKNYGKLENNELDTYLRSSNPLGTRELQILADFDHFTFAGFYDATNMYQQDAGYKNLYPIWKCYDSEGYSFEYYLEAGEMQIVG